MPVRHEDTGRKNFRVGCNSQNRINQTVALKQSKKANVKGLFEGRQTPRQTLVNSTKQANVSSPKHQFQQLVERVRELQKEIVPDVLYQIPTAYSSFTSMTPSSNVGRRSISAYPYRQSISLSSGSSSSSLTNPRLQLSSRVLERAHQIPDRFWLDWQEKQMQDRIEELEYIKNNIGCSSTSSLLLNETDENAMNFSRFDGRTSYDELCRQSLLFLQEAQRLANERRASLTRANAVDEPELHDDDDDDDDDDNVDDGGGNDITSTSHSPDVNEPSFSFDQRSEEISDIESLNDSEKIPSESFTPVPAELKSPSTLDRSRLSISIPFTYMNTGESIMSSNNQLPLPVEPTLKKPIEVDEKAVQTSSPASSTEDVAQIHTEVSVTIIKREHPQEIRPLLYSKATVNRSIEFQKFRPIFSSHTMALLQNDRATPMSVLKRKEISDSRSSSPTLSFKSARSTFSPIGDNDDNDRHLIHNTQSTPENLPMTHVYGLRRNHKLFSCSLMLSEEESQVSCSRALFTCRRWQVKKKKKPNTLDIGSMSPKPSENNLKLPSGSLKCAKQNHTNCNNNINICTMTLKNPCNPSTCSEENTIKSKPNLVGFQEHLLTNVNNRSEYDCVEGDDKNPCRSLSSPTSTSNYFPRREQRKQTRSKRKIESNAREKKKERKKERNKKSSSSTPAEGSLFHFLSDSTPTIDTSATYPYEQGNCTDRSITIERNCFVVQKSVEHQQRQKHTFESDSTMAESCGQPHLTANIHNSRSKQKENFRVFVHHRRRTFRHRQCVPPRSPSCINSHGAVSSSPRNVNELVSLIQRQVNKQKKYSNNRNVIVVNYKPVFVNARRQKSSSQAKAKSTVQPVSERKTKPPANNDDDEDASSATHYSRQRPQAVVTTSPDESPVRSTSNYSNYQHSLSVDVPDVEDPLMFIELMYRQLFTEDGQLRSEAEPTVIADCVKQIVTNSRKNSMSSANLKNKESDTAREKYITSSSSHSHVQLQKPVVVSSTSRRTQDVNYSTSSEEDPNVPKHKSTPYSIVNQRTTKLLQNSQRLNTNNYLPNHLSIERCYPYTTLPGRNRPNHIQITQSKDDTDNDELDTLSDHNSVRLINHKIVRTSPSTHEDVSPSDSRLFSSSGYHSLEQSKKLFEQRKATPMKIHSEIDPVPSIHQKSNPIKSINRCSSCMCSSDFTVIPPIVPIALSLANIVKRMRLPFGKIFMKYVNFILISKNVLLLPLFIFLLRQRSTHLEN